MDFEPYFKVHSLVSVHPKSIILTQMTNLDTIFHVVVSQFIDLLKCETRPCSLLNLERSISLVFCQKNVYKMILNQHEV